MGHERLSGLAMLSMNKNTEVIPEEVLDTFARKHPWKLQLEFI
jgi:hypothetical protein